MATSENGFGYQAKLPLSWQKVEQFSDVDLDRWMHANAVFLRALAVLETPLPEADKAMERLEAKVDLSLFLLTQLLSQHTPMPSPRPLSLNAQNMEWTDDQSPEVESCVLARLYLSPRLPQPLILPLTVLSISTMESGFRIHACLSHLSEEVQDWLERTLFRYHRRAIQQHVR